MTHAPKPAPRPRMVARMKCGRRGCIVRATAIDQVPVSESSQFYLKSLIFREFRSGKLCVRLY